MTGKNDDAAREDVLLGGLVPRVTEHLAEQRAQDFDADAGQSRFRAWLTTHTREHTPGNRPSLSVAESLSATAARTLAPTHAC
jgi:hypothetical protein